MLTKRPGMAHFGEGKQKRERGFRALVLIDAVNVQAIPTATALGIIERKTEVVASLEPFECLAARVSQYGSPVAS